MPVRVDIGNVPKWLDHERLLGPGYDIEAQEAGWVHATASLERPAAADVQARLRNVGIGGRALEVKVTPPLNRKLVRNARTEDARRRRKSSVGFSRSGVELDREGQVSLTPEALALQLGKRAGRRIVVDACCGVGGNAIGFARAGCKVLAIELDKARIDMARHNAKVYGVSQSIEWRCGDAIRELATCHGDLLFVDPPWGEDYDRSRVRLADLPFLQAVLKAAERFPRVWLKVPPSFNVADVPDARPSAVFGVGEGDRQRVKFLLLEIASPDEQP